MSDDPYHVLGLERGASDTQVRTAYRRLALLNHPDRYALASPMLQRVAQRKMSELNLAYAAIGPRRHVRRPEESPAARRRRHEEAVRAEKYRRWEEAEARARVQVSEEDGREAVRRAAEEHARRTTQEVCARAEETRRRRSPSAAARRVTEEQARAIHEDIENLRAGLAG